MKDKPKCPFWNEKKGECKLTEMMSNLTDTNKLLAKIAEAYAPQTTSLGPVPGSHGMVVGSSPIPPRPPGGILESLSKIGLQVFPPKPESQPAYFGEEEDQKEKQEYWEKELKKMDKEKKNKNDLG